MSLRIKRGDRVQSRDGIVHEVSGASWRSPAHTSIKWYALCGTTRIIINSRQRMTCNDKPVTCLACLEGTDTLSVQIPLWVK